MLWEERQKETNRLNGNTNDAITITDYMETQTLHLLYFQHSATIAIIKGYDMTF